MAWRLRGLRNRLSFDYEIDDKDLPQTSGWANAVVGSYLTRLGLSYGAIAYVTKAAPDEIEWLSPATAKQYGITYRFLQK
jgi:hypothetical protein